MRLCRCVYLCLTVMCWVRCRTTITLSLLPLNLWLCEMSDWNERVFVARFNNMERTLLLCFTFCCCCCYYCFVRCWWWWWWRCVCVYCTAVWRDSPPSLSRLYVFKIRIRLDCRIVHYDCRLLNHRMKQITSRIAYFTISTFWLLLLLLLLLLFYIGDGCNMVHAPYVLWRWIFRSDRFHAANCSKSNKIHLATKNNFNGKTNFSWNYRLPNLNFCARNFGRFNSNIGK